MKTVFWIIIVVLFCNCSRDDAPETSVIKPIHINFVKEDGTSVTTFDCINPNDKYFVSIVVEAEGSGTVEKTLVEYTVNGVLHSMVFTGIENQRNQIILKEGENVAQLVDTGIYAKVSYVAAEAFELVE
ncbi:hypothetical protein HN014_11245 [Aquimarina sp. TRL1]|uniref:hypothetical protein n=1 Tax=Aquimarina sp. (strain TRL1) TaxID=2736252 RepID=UPI00158899B1|nr:hypothetical protein [Aquimarina sp. TRL1]QKX05465.1 hypothetical protein HN014_11245 [Aquimarina sp. TRL1]